jgi:hypothetical protein
MAAFSFSLPAPAPAPRAATATGGIGGWTGRSMWLCVRQQPQHHSSSSW